MKLWPHQQRCLDELADVKAGEAVCVASPTGSGKTRIMSELCTDGRSVALYTNRRMLLEQTSAVLSARGIRHGIRAAGHSTDFTAPVQLCSIQTTAARTLKRDKWPLAHAETIIFDEAHINKEATACTIIDRHIEAGARVLGFTATPLGLGHIYDRLITACTISEARECGALVPALTFAPDEPDAKGLKRTKTGEYTEGDVRKVIMTHTILGRVVDHWRRLNPEGHATILFAPGVKESIWFAEQLCEAGIPAAHIDGDTVWLNGKVYESDQPARDELKKMSEGGEVEIICNRFVLREGIDFPHVRHLIFATIFGALSSYIQSGGRGLRAYPGKTHCCIARGTPVLTNRGLVPIQDVTTDDLVWDGIDFVKHDGPVCQGITEVIQWDGLVATPDHKVLTQHGWITLQEAASRRERLTQSENGGKEIRVRDNSDPHSAWGWPETSGGSRLRQVRETIVPPIPQDRQAHPARLRALYESVRRSLSRMDLSSRAAPVATVQRSKAHHIRAIWRQGHPVPVRVDLCSHMLDRLNPWRSDRQVADSRQDRQRRELRTRQPAMGDSNNPVSQSGMCVAIPIQEEIPACNLLQFILAVSASHNDTEPDRCVLRENQEAMRSVEASRESGRGNGVLNNPLLQPAPKGVQRAGYRTAEVWDILNAGPRHRFTAASVLVANCVQDHGGNFHRHGSLNSDREWFLDRTDYMVSEMREESMRKKEMPEPIVCPKCMQVRGSGPVCPGCGHTHSKRSRMVIQKDGTLREVAGDIYKPRRITRDPNAADKWASCYHAAKREGKTFREARGKYAYRHNWEFPPDNLPLMPKSALDWFLPIKDVPMDRLHQAKECAA